MTTTTGHLQTFSHDRWRKIVDVWNTVQLTRYGGKYSFERMLALEEFTRNTSLLRVVLITAAPPALLILIVLGQESIPLQNPAAGWHDNYGFWLRVGIMGSSLAYSVRDQLVPWLDVPGLSWKQTIVYCALVGAGFIATGVVAAEIWVFPIPFHVNTLALILVPILLVSFRVSVGSRQFGMILSRREQLRRLSKFAALQGLMAMVHPAYQVLFNKANHTNYELPVLLALPAFKFVMKIVFAVVAGGYNEDLVPGQVVFTVDFFDAFYLATFMPNLSTTSLAVIMVVDLVQTGVELRELHERTEHILSRLRKAASITDSNDSLLTSARSLCYNLKVIRNGNIRVRSCIPHRLSEEGKTMIQKLSLPDSDMVSNPTAVIFSEHRNILAVLPQPHTANAKQSSQAPKLPIMILGAIRRCVKVLEYSRSHLKYTSRQNVSFLLNTWSVLSLSYTAASF